MNQSFLFFELIGIFIVHWLILEPQTYVVVEQFGAENIPLLSGRLVLYKCEFFDVFNKGKALFESQGRPLRFFSWYCDIYEGFLNNCS